MVQLKTCRLCLKPTLTSFSLLKPELNTVLEALTSIKVDESGATEACVKCCLNLKLAHKIQQNILRAEEKLKKSPVVNKKATMCIKLESMTMVSEALCVICESMVEENLLDQHIKSHFDGSEKCHLCNKEFRDLASYKEHLLNHPVNIVIVSEPGVGEHSTKASDNHKNSKPQKRKEPMVKTTNSDKIVASHLGKKGIGKDLAQKLMAISKQKNIKIRPDKKLLFIKPKPSDSGGFPCDKCNVIFPTLEQFNKHPHGRKPCPICKKEVTYGNLHDHIKIHENSPQVCHYCGVTFANLGILRGHIVTKHERRTYKCKKCKIDFVTKQRYHKHHSKYHSKPENVCGICGRSFFFKYALDNHVAGTHLQDSPNVKIV